MFRLDREHWRELSPLLDQALDLDAAARNALLADLERRRPELALVLARLLTGHDQLLGSGFLETSLRLDDAPTLAGHTVGQASTR